MSVVGVMKLRPFDNDGQHYEGSGKVATLNVGFTFALQRLDSGRSGDNVPLYTLFVRNPGGQAVAIGAVWRKLPRDGGAAFYTLTLDDPSFDETLYLTGFPKDGSPDTFELVWRRARKAKPKPAASDDAGDDLGDDEIPF